MPQNAIPRPEHPRPQFRRDAWVNLNGVWDYTFDFGNSGADFGREWHKSTGFDAEITVPFAPESALSGVNHRDFIPAIWYHRRIAIPAGWEGKRILFHAGAVDQIATVWIDGREAGVHYGGTVSFTFDITALVTPGREHHLVLRAADDQRSGRFGAGKQSPLHGSHACSYTRTTGIWQTVWLEAAAPEGLARCRIVPDLDNGAFAFLPEWFADCRSRRWRIEIKAGGTVAAAAEFAAGTAAPVILKLSEIHPWAPGAPFLYDVTYTVLDAGGNELERVESYAGLRKISVEGDRILLNNQPLFLRLVLDQGYYPDGNWTAPDDAALKRDIEIAMAAGFNGARLHQKVFEERFHYWADRLGYLTWGESSSWGLDLDSAEARGNFLLEWQEIVIRDLNHPSIIAWTPLNESRPPDPALLQAIFPTPAKLEIYRRWVRDLYDATKRIDPTRPVNDSSGYLHVKTDLWTVHLYRPDAAQLAEALFPAAGGVYRHAPDFETGYRGQPYLNDEFGGFMFIPPERARFAANTWGYHGLDLKNEDELCALIAAQVDLMTGDKRLSGYCYTQLTDVEQEQNGLYNYDRTPKVPSGKLARIFTRR